MNLVLCTLKPEQNMVTLFDTLLNRNHKISLDDFLQLTQKVMIAI